MQVVIDVKCMNTNFLVGVASLVLEIMLTFKNGQIPLWTMDYIVLGVKK